MHTKPNGDPYTADDLPRCKKHLATLQEQAELLEAELETAIAVAGVADADLDTLKAEHEQIDAEFLELSKRFRSAKETFESTQAELSKCLQRQSDLRGLTWCPNGRPEPGTVCFACGQAVTDKSDAALKAAIAAHNAELKELQEGTENLTEARNKVQSQRDKLQAEVSVLAEKEAMASLRLVNKEKGATGDARDADAIRADLSKLRARIKIGKSIVSELEG